MKQYYLPATVTTPEVNFDPDSGLLAIKGRAIPNDAKEFWTPILDWFYAYSKRPNHSTKLVFQIDYFNAASAKKMLFLMNQVNFLHGMGYHVSIQWNYSSADDEMREAGEDFSAMIDFRFDFEIIDPMHSIAS